MTNHNEICDARRPKQRVAAMPWKALVVFLFAFGLGAIIALILNPFLAPYVGSLAIPIYGTVTLSFVLINGTITFPVLILVNRYFHTHDE